MTLTILIMLLDTIEIDQFVPLYKLLHCHLQVDGNSTEEIIVQKQKFPKLMKVKPTRA